MEKDINLIVDVDRGEAQALIGLVEMLFDEWYVARRKRADRLAGILKIAEAKEEAARLAKPEAADDRGLGRGRGDHRPLGRG